jgi:hypothetical protein
MAVNDDIYTAENILSKQVGIRHPECTSRRPVHLIKAAIESGSVLSFKRQGCKGKACLSTPSQRYETHWLHSRTQSETERRESCCRHVASRQCPAPLIESPRLHSETMQNPVMRNKLFECPLTVALSQGTVASNRRTGQREQALADLRFQRGLRGRRKSDVPDSFDTSNIETTLDGDSLEDEVLSNASIHDDGVSHLEKFHSSADLSPLVIQ